MELSISLESTPRIFNKNYNILLIKALLTKALMNRSEEWPIIPKKKLTIWSLALLVLRHRSSF